MKSAAILEQLYAKNPQHPGITHYLIHAYDFAPFADKGIPAARRYAAIAPAVPHARHMPAHIYSMVGLWEDSITSNLSALEIQPDYYHAADFAVYAHLQLAQDAQGGGADRESAEYARARRSPADHRQLHGAGGDAGALRARARGLGSGGGPAGDVASAIRKPTRSRTSRAASAWRARRNERGARSRRSTRCESLRRSLQNPGEWYWADRTQEQMLAVSAWVALADGAPDKAIALMRRAADGEDGSIKHVAMENRLYPMRELLGDLLLEAGQPAEAFAEFTKALKQTPEPLSRPLRRRARRGSVRRSAERGRLLHEAHSACLDRRWLAAGAAARQGVRDAPVTPLARAMRFSLAVGVRLHDRTTCGSARLGELEVAA